MSEKMTCPSCGVEMNFHAEKLIYSDTELKPSNAMGGRIEEMHACPRCGNAESRAAL